MENQVTSKDIEIPASLLDHPEHHALVEKLIGMIDQKDATILDFFNAEIKAMDKVIELEDKIAAALSGKGLNVTKTGLPAPRMDLTDMWDITAGWSDYVLAVIEGFQGVHVCRYAHGCDEWKVSFINGNVVVKEWWPLPSVGTGVKVVK